MHEGHRKRLSAKLESDENGLYDHEILEILLFNAYPRVNTNPIAHALMDRFCSLSEVLNASVDELMTVPGVGEQTAHYLRIVGLCLKRTGAIEGVAQLKTFGDCKRFVSMRFRGKSEEFLEIYFTEKSGRVKRIFSFTSSDRNRVRISSEKLVEEIAAAKPYGIIIAHNHLNGSCAPSESDEDFTKQVQLICSMNNVVLLDHFIYAADDNIFSYNDSGRLDNIRRKYSLDNVTKWITDSN